MLFYSVEKCQDRPSRPIQLSFKAAGQPGQVLLGLAFPAHVTLYGASPLGWPMSVHMHGPFALLELASMPETGSCVPDCAAWRTASS